MIVVNMAKVGESLLESFGELIREGIIEEKDRMWVCDFATKLLMSIKDKPMGEPPPGVVPGDMSGAVARVNYAALRLAASAYRCIAEEAGETFGPVEPPPEPQAAEDQQVWCIQGRHPGQPEWGFAAIVLPMLGTTPAVAMHVGAARAMFQHFAKVIESDLGGAEYRLLHFTRGEDITGLAKRGLL
jgi:hypothetical protein